MTMRVVRLVAMVGYRRTVKPGNKSMQPTGLHSACLSAWWRQADLSVSTNTHHTTLAFAHRPVLLDWAGVHSHRKVQTCSRNHVFLYIAFTRRASNVRSSHVCVRHERIEHDVPRDRKQSPRSTYLANFFFLDPSKVHQLPSIYTLFRSYRGLFSREIPRNPSSHFNRVLTHLFFLLMNDKYLNSLMMRSLSRGHFFYRIHKVDIPSVKYPETWLSSTGYITAIAELGRRPRKVSKLYKYRAIAVSINTTLLSVIKKKKEK